MIPKTTVGNVKHLPKMTLRNVLLDFENVYCGRPKSTMVSSMDFPEGWGNPYYASKATCNWCNKIHAQAEETIPCYRGWLWQQIREEKPGYSLIDLASLAGKKLYCCCAPAPCHCDVLAKAAEWAVTQLPDTPIEGFQGQYRFLSNFWPVFNQIYPSGLNLEMPTVEHAYVIRKTDFDIVGTVVNQEALDAYRAKYPGQIKKESKSLKTIPDWNEVRLAFMEECVEQKFMRGNAHLARRLLATRNRELIETNTWGDTFWGVCKGKGDNNLGQILMRVRTKLRESHPKF